MKKYKGMCLYSRGILDGKVIEAESESQLLRLASRIANKRPAKMDVLYVDYIAVDENEVESEPLPQQYFVRLSGRKWVYKGNNPYAKVVPDSSVS
jgi:hypothetical protein